MGEEVWMGTHFLDAKMRERKVQRREGADDVACRRVDMWLASQSYERLKMRSWTFSAPK